MPRLNPVSRRELVRKLKRLMNGKTPEILGRGSKVILVAYSTGGIIARYLLVHCGELFQE